MSESLRFAASMNSNRNYIKEVNESDNSESSGSNEEINQNKNNPPIPIQPANTHTNPPSTITI